MSLSRNSRFDTPRMPSSRQEKDGPVLAVGWRVLVTSPDGRAQRVTLTDADGTSALATVAAGAEVEILAWRPHRSGGTRYRVVPTNGGTEGWLGAASLAPRQRPVSRPPVAAAAPIKVKVPPPVAPKAKARRPVRAAAKRSS